MTVLEAEVAFQSALRFYETTVAMFPGTKGDHGPLDRAVLRLMRAWSDVIEARRAA
jgi:hypothetical protein